VTYSYLRSGKATAIRGLNSDFVDSDSALMAVLALNKKLGTTQAHFLRHTTNFLFTGAEADRKNATSYFSITYAKPAVRDELSILAGGDLMLARSVGTTFASKGAEWLVGDISQTTQDADLFFVNLESVISDKGFDGGGDLSFRAKPQTMEVVTLLGVDVASVANNHTGDFGRSAWEDSVARLRAASVLPVGSLNGYSLEPVVTEVRGKKIAYFAFDMVFKNPPLDELAQAVKTADEDADLVVVSTHWGVEYQKTHNATQEKIAHALVDAGADLVIGSHPHVVQDVETYKGKTILYSLGNLLFDQWWSQETMRGELARVTFQSDGAQRAELIQTNNYEKKIGLGW